MTLSLSMATFCRPNFYFAITCTSVTAGIMINRRQL